MVKSNIRLKYMVVTFMLLFSVTGCSFALPTEERVDREEIQQVQEENASYLVPQNVPNVLVDQNGYEMNSTKIALFRGNDLQGSFEVIDAESGENVYTGDIVAKGLDEKTGEYISYGSFSELEKVGTYYIQTAKIGQSYPFVIRENLYGELIPKIEKALFYNRCGMDITAEYADEVHIHKACHTQKPKISQIGNSSDKYKESLVEKDLSGGWHTDENGNRDVSQGCLIAQNLLLVDEFYESCMTDDVGIPESGNQIPDVLDEVRYEIEWLRKMQNVNTGGVYGGIINNQISEESITATADFASTMALFYHSYEKYDKEYAKSCLIMAENAWKYLNKNVTVPNENNEIEDMARYNAAAQLFKTTNSANYHIYIKEHYEAECDEEADAENRELFGDIAYLTTTQKVDTNICKALMDKWMDRAERIVEEAKKDYYFVIGDLEQSVLDEMVCLSVIDHVITNHEYVTVLESHLHFFLGRNKEAVSYIEGFGAVHPSEKDIQKELTHRSRMSAALIFMLEEIVTEDTEEFGE